MLLQLEVQGLSLLSDVKIRLKPGLNALTGESGAGKSLLVNALGLLLGERAHPVQLRAGNASALVAAEFRLPEGIGQDLRREFGLQGDAVRVTREVRARGRGQCLIDGDAVSLARLSALCAQLVSFTGQHAAHTAADGGLLIDALDQQIGSNPALREYRAAYEQLQSVVLELQRLESRASNIDAQKALYKEQLEQLHSLAPKAGECRRLTEQLELFRRSRTLLELGARVEQVIREREASLEDEIRGLIQGLKRSLDVLALTQISEELCAALGALERAADTARDLCERADLEPRQVEALEERLDALLRLGREFRCEADDLHLARERLEQELAEIETIEARLTPLRQQARSLDDQARELARALHEQRCEVAGALERRVAKELAALKLDGARILFRLALQPGELSARGLSEAEVLFSANPGEALAPFDRVASGGERSRLLLALRCAGAFGGVPTLVFDEIDAGVGGATARAIGERLRRAARGRQVLCITHHASVAAFADAHLCVRKITEKGRTHSLVSEVEGEARILELSRMLAGAEEPRGARALALSLLHSASAERKSRRAA